MAIKQQITPRVMAINRFVTVPALRTQWRTGEPNWALSVDA